MERTTARNDRYRLWLIGGLGVLAAAYLLLSYYFFGPFRHSRLGLIDDHEILRFLGRDHRIGMTDVPGILFGQTEVGQWGTATRLRPVYYLLRIIEAALWRDDAALWYLARTVLVAVTAACLSLAVLRTLIPAATGTARRLLALVVAASAGLLVLGLPAWADIATRLGPSEIYVSLGIGLSIVGLVELWRRAERLGGWILFVVGYLVIVGSKEDGILFLVPFAVVFVLRFGGARHRLAVAILGAVAILATGYVTLGILLGTSGTGEDMYGDARSLRVFAALLPGNPFLIATIFCLLLTVGFEVATGRAGERGDAGADARSDAGRAFTRAIRLLRGFPLSLVTAACGYVIVVDAYFYQNTYFGTHSPSRYAFLSDLASVVAVVALVVAAFLFTAARFPLRSGGRRIAAAGFVVLLLAVSPAAANVHAAAAFRGQSSAAAAASVATSLRIRAGIADLESHPGSRALIIAQQPTDYEPVFALPQFLNYYGTTRSAFLEVAIPSATYSGSPFAANLVRQLEVIAVEGKHEDGWHIRPASARGSNGYTVCFAFTSAPAEATGCDAVYVVPR